MVCSPSVKLQEGHQHWDLSEEPTKILVWDKNVSLQGCLAYCTHPPRCVRQLFARWVRKESIREVPRLYEFMITERVRKESLWVCMIKEAQWTLACEDGVWIKLRLELYRIFSRYFYPHISMNWYFNADICLRIFVRWYISWCRYFNVDILIIKEDIGCEAAVWRPCRLDLCSA